MNSKFFYIIFLSLCSFTNIQADPLTSIKTSHAIETLSTDTRDLLKKEMLALETGLKSMVIAYIQGDWDRIGQISQKMHHSYILKQQLTLSQKKELKQKLTLTFIKRDQAFHQLAAELNQITKSKNSVLIQQQINKLTNACLACHQIYATKRFSTLKTMD